LTLAQLSVIMFIKRQTVQVTPQNHAKEIRITMAQLWN